LRILIAGDWHSELHEEAIFHALGKLGHVVTAFSWHQYFRPSVGWITRLDSLARRAQNKYLIGPQITRLNLDLIAQAAREQPDMVLIYRGTHILPETLRQLHLVVPDVALVGYNNDDPFAPNYPRWMWRHFLNGVPEYDLMLAYRHRNLEDFRQAGARRVELLRSWFIPERNHPIELSDGDLSRYACDVVFVGHYEPDDRLIYLEALVERGIDFRLFGPEWGRAARTSPWLSKLGTIQPVRGDDYLRALCGAKIALCFFSGLNRDTYTRRCFEIPATRTMMLSQYTEDVATLFREGEEIEFFRTPEEMFSKIKTYLDDNVRRQAVADAGWKRVHADGHDVVSRMRQVVNWVEDVRGLLQ
jgi:spore maturation protein CgeB